MSRIEPRPLCEKQECYLCAIQPPAVCALCLCIFQLCSVNEFWILEQNAQRNLLRLCLTASLMVDQKHKTKDISELCHNYNQGLLWENVLCWHNFIRVTLVNGISSRHRQGKACRDQIWRPEPRWVDLVLPRARAERHHGWILRRRRRWVPIPAVLFPWRLTLIAFKVKGYRHPGVLSSSLLSHV